MRFAIVLLALAATSFAAPAPIVRGPGDLQGRGLIQDIIATLVAVLSDLRGGRGIRGSHPGVPLPTGTVTIKATTLPATTLQATTVPATTIPSTVIGSTTIPATTLPASTLPATTLSASTVSPTTVVINPSSSSSVASSAASSAASSSASSAVTSAATTGTPTSSQAAASSVATLDCIVSSTPLPSGASALPAPTGTFVGSFTGTGHQNYDCSTATSSSSAPVSIGANANLTGTCGTGVHSFDNPTSPRFNMIELGNTLAAKNATVASPDGATNVAWLKLNAVDSTGSIVNVYRVSTQGGVAPATCGNNTGTIEVNYQANYFFFQE